MRTFQLIKEVNECVKAKKRLKLSERISPEGVFWLKIEDGKIIPKTIRINAVQSENQTFLFWKAMTSAYIKTARAKTNHLISILKNYITI